MTPSPTRFAALLIATLSLPCSRAPAQNPPWVELSENQGLIIKLLGAETGRHALMVAYVSAVGGSGEEEGFLGAVFPELFEAYEDEQDYRNAMQALTSEMTFVAPAPPEPVTLSIPAEVVEQTLAPFSTFSISAGSSFARAAQILAQPIPAALPPSPTELTWNGAPPGWATVQAGEPLPVIPWGMVTIPGDSSKFHLESLVRVLLANQFNLLGPEGAGVGPFSWQVNQIIGLIENDEDFDLNVGSLEARPGPNSKDPPKIKVTRIRKLRIILPPNGSEWPLVRFSAVEGTVWRYPGTPPLPFTVETYVPLDSSDDGNLFIAIPKTDGHALMPAQVEVGTHYLTCSVPSNAVDGTGYVWDQREGGIVRGVTNPSAGSSPVFQFTMINP